MTTESHIRQALAADSQQTGELLAACGLPTSGVEDYFPGGYAVAVADESVAGQSMTSGTIVGVAGIEVHGRYGLLRSVAVLPVWRHQSMGRRLVENRLAWAATTGLADVYLLTTGAEGYFGRLGFVRVERGAVPDEIKASAEFASVCPESATVMIKQRVSSFG